jgi:hypothetical protein
MAPLLILSWTNHPCSRVECHSRYQSHYGCNTSCTTTFSKTYGEKTLRCPCKEYGSLNRWQANWNLFFAFTLCNLIFCNDAPTKRLEGKFPPAGWCESQTSPLKMWFAWGQSLSCRRGCVSVMRLATIVHLGRGDLGMSHGLFLKTWIHSHNICNAIRAALNTWAPLGYKWWCMSYIYMMCSLKVR